MRRGVGDVAMADHDAADLLGQRLDALFQRIALIGEGELGAVGMAGFGNTPASDRLLATPMIRPRLPRMRPEISGIFSDPTQPSPVPGFLWHRAVGASSRAATEHQRPR